MERSLLVATVSYKRGGRGEQREVRARAAMVLWQRVVGMLSRATSLPINDCCSRLMYMLGGCDTAADFEIEVRPATTVSGGSVAAFDKMNAATFLREVHDFLAELNDAQPAGQVETVQVLIHAATSSGAVVRMSGGDILHSWGNMPPTGTCLHRNYPVV